MVKFKSRKVIVTTKKELEKALANSKIDKRDIIYDIAVIVEMAGFPKERKRNEELVQAENRMKNGYYNNFLYNPTNIEFAIGYGKYSEETFLKGLKRIKRN